MITLQMKNWGKSVAKVERHTRLHTVRAWVLTRKEIEIKYWLFSAGSPGIHY